MARPSAPAARRASARRATRRPRGPVIPIVAGVAVVATVATLAVVLDGYDAQEVPPLSSSVWVTRDTGQYARVNTELAEIDTVRSADDPSGVVQAGDVGLVYTQGFGRAWPIDAADPGDLGGSADEPAEGEEAAALGEATPNGTREVQQSGPWVAYLTETGGAYLGGLPVDGALAVPALLEPYRDLELGEDEEPPTYVADAVAVDGDGLVALYSAAEEAVRLYDAPRDEFRAAVDVPEPPSADADLSLALVQGRWALFDGASGDLWIEGRAEPLDTGLEDGLLQLSDATGTRIHLADAERLIAVDGGTGGVEELAEGVGRPARPTVVDGEVVAAWLSSTSGRLWTEGDGELDLEVPDESLEDVDTILPVIRSNGQRAMLNETASGMLWRVPDGAFIPAEQWSLEDEENRDEGTIVVDDVAEQEPPVAVADAFGVRSGELVGLPVLLNDHDPNKKDVLTVVPESVTGVGDFGTLSLAASNQQIVVRVAAGSGSASFTYAVTDGVSTSPPATVTLSVVPPDVNTAPEWCGVEACVQEWPSPGISAGGTVTVPVLSGWVDREGDVIVLADAVKDDPAAPVTVVANAEGDVVVRHQDPNATDAVIPITVTVADAHGATATKTLEIRVTGNPALVAEPIAAVGGVDEKVSVDVAKHVRGGSGSFAIVDAVQTSSAGGLVVVPNAAAGRIDLTASAPGDYVVTYTVQDLQSLAQQSAILRYTVVASGAPLSIAPITAFVRPNEDTTVDVLAAVQNTTGRVLLVSEAAISEPALGVSVVAQSRVRVSGSTPDGQPGRIGAASVTVTDGAGNSVQGTITVFLVAASTATGPIAVPDTATVRAGAQADIPVLANDVSPRGERIVLHPEVGGSGTEGELAFASGDRVRYLAPSAPGVYTLRYSVYLENSPQLLDSASITVTVLPPGANRDPQPPILTARVLAGQSVAIPFPASGVDPDGDRVVLADVTQPESGLGLAEISAEGDAIVYTAPGNGVTGGQVSFAYRVRDAEGATAEGVVRVGVLATDVADVAPVTYGDYVRVQAGTTSPLTVAPLLNDRDPLQGRLELVSVVPNAVPGTTEYARLEALLDASALDEGELTLTAGDVEGVHSYVYTVQSQASFSSAEGLIVVGVTDAPSPDAPAIADTVVTAQNRGQLEDGLDVVTGRVQWASGDVSGLKLAVWGPAASRYTVDGWRIAGPLPRDGDIVPFSLTGTTPSGGEIVSYGFLRIPAFDDMRIQLRAGIEPITVGEEASAEATVRELLDLAASDDVEIRRDDEFAVQRANSSCVPVSATRVRYTAGREAPWSDTCTVPVRIEGQDTWTALGIPVVVEPKDPQAQLNSLSRTIAPNATETIDLYDQMTSWEGGRVGDTSVLDYAISYSGSAFQVTQQSDGTVSILTFADARPGTRETIIVTVDAYGGLRAGINLQVGIAPPDAPRGATFSHRCTVTDASCAITVVDRPGEYDPFAGNPRDGLELVSVGAGGTVTCPVATVRMSDARQVVATWPSGPKPVGGECVVAYTVADAQGRTGQGQLTLDVYGYPQTPASVVTTGYTGTSVTLHVDLGSARSAHPETTGVVLYEGSSPAQDASCAPSGVDYSCVVTGLVNGERHHFTARAVNSVGESASTTAVETWSYAKPEVSALTTASVYVAGTTTQSAGVVRVGITAEADAQAYRVLADGVVVTTLSRTGGTTTGDLTLAPGTRTIEVIPISQFTPPLPGSNEGDAVTRTGLSVGSPIVTSNGSPGSTSATSVSLAGVAFSGNNSPQTASVTYYAWRSGNPQCVSTASGGHQVTGAEATSTSSTVSGLVENEDYRIAACASYGFGAIASAPVETYTFQPPPGPVGPLEYTISTSSSGTQTRTWGLGSYAQPSAPSGFQTRYRVDGGGLQNSIGSLPVDHVPTIEVLFCRNLGGAPRCSDPTPMTAAAGGPPTAAQVVFPTCSVIGDERDPVVVAGLVSGVAHASGKFSATATVEEETFLGIPTGRWEYDFALTWTDPAYAALSGASYSTTCDE